MIVLVITGVMVAVKMEMLERGMLVMMYGDSDVVGNVVTVAIMAVMEVVQGEMM